MSALRGGRHRIPRTLAVSSLAPVVVGAILLSLATAATPAAASPTQLTVFDASRELLDPESQQSRELTLDRLDSLGVDLVHVVIPWRWLAPEPDASEKPSFDAAAPGAYPQSAWRNLDASVRGIAARGMETLLVATGPVPNWATRSGRSALEDPIPEEFRMYVTALGRRYGGHWCPPHDCAQGALPRVRWWSIWNEPNLAYFLAPVYRDGKPYSPLLYRQLFLAADGALRATGHGADRVLIGETAPTASSTGGLNPVAFMRRAFCMGDGGGASRSCAPIDADGWAHHPYNAKQTPLWHPPGHFGMANLDRLIGALGEAAARGATRRRLPVYLTEYGVMTHPWEGGVEPAEQPALLAISEFLAWREPEVASYGQYLLEDDPPQFEFSYTTGLLFNDGRPKPSYRAFALTLMVKRLGGGRVRLWGHLRPGAGRVTLRVRTAKGKVRRLRQVRTDARGYFGLRSAYLDGASWQALAAGPARRGPPLRGPFVRAYGFR